MLAALAAALLQPATLPAPPAPMPLAPRPPPPVVWPRGFPRPESRPPAPPPLPGRRDIAVDTVYTLSCRVVAEDGVPFQLEAKTSGRGAARRMAIESGAPDRFPSGTAEAGQAYSRNWVADDYVEVFTLDRQDSVYTLTLAWAAGRLADAALTTLRPASDPPFGSPGTTTCRRL